MDEDEGRLLGGFVGVPIQVVKVRWSRSFGGRIGTSPLGWRTLTRLTPWCAPRHESWERRLFGGLPRPGATSVARVVLMSVVYSGPAACTDDLAAISKH